MDFSWLAGVNNPIAAFVVIAVMFVGALAWIVNKFLNANTRILDKAIEKGDKNEERMLNVIDRNTQASTEQAVLSRTQSDAIFKMASAVEKCNLRPERPSREGD